VVGGEGGAGEFFDRERLVGSVEDCGFHGRLPGVRLALRGIALMIMVVRCGVGMGEWVDGLWRRFGWFDLADF
jgi:hypothetical protein